MFKSFFLKILLVIVIILLQFNFANILFFETIYSPNIILLTVIAWTLVSGFKNIWKWILLLGILTGIVGNYYPGFSVLLFLTISYLTDFLKNRFSLESGFWKSLSLLSFIVLMAMYKKFAHFEFLENKKYLPTLTIDKKSLNASVFIGEIVFSLLFFFVIFFILKKMEEYLKKKSTGIL